LFRSRCISSGPCTPEWSACQSSTSVVVINWPPCSSPVIKTGLRLARAAYTAALYPAGPEPKIKTLACLGAVIPSVPINKLTPHYNESWLDYLLLPHEVD